MTDHDFIVGINYWPQRTAMSMWRHFDPATIKEDMATIGELGCSCLRIFLLWEDFQPRPRQCSVPMLDNLVKLMELAGDRGLKVMPALFTGYAAGLTWLPPWMLLASTAGEAQEVFSLGKVRSLRPKNPYEDTEVIEAQLYFLRELLNALSGHPALLAWDLGNEPCRWAEPPDETTVSIWFQAVTETLRERTGSVAITLGLGTQDLEANPRLSLILPSRYLDYVSLHVYPYRLPWAEGPTDPGPLPFLASIARWLAKKPVLLQEFGVPTAPVLGQVETSRQLPDDLMLVDEADAARFAEKALNLAHRFKTAGALWGAFGDYHPTVWTRPPLDRNVPERFAGLVRHDGSPKAAATLFKSSTAPAGSGDSEVSAEWLDITEEEYLQDPETNLRRLYRRFRECEVLMTS
jgi:endo-1,4-beta-mannosidase